VFRSPTHLVKTPRRSSLRFLASGRARSHTDPDRVFLIGVYWPVGSFECALHFYFLSRNSDVAISGFFRWH